MKNTSFYILIILVISLASCEKDNQNEFYDLGTEFLVSNDGYSSLDTEVTFTIDNLKKNLTEVTMLDHGTVALTDGVGSITLTSSELGISAADDEATYQFDGIFEGKSIIRYEGITVKNPMSLTSPYIWALNDEDEMVETSVIVYQNDEVQYIKYDIAPKRATVESLLIETKVGEDGTYAIVPGDFDTSFDSLSVVGSNYLPTEVVYYKFTAKNGTHEQVGEIHFTINQVTFPNAGGAHLGVIDATTTQGFDLLTNEIVPAGTDTTSFAMSHVILTSVGLESSNGTLFVLADAATYDNNNVVEVKALFDAGTQESGFASINDGDYFIYKTGDNYGVIKISAVYLTTDGLGDYFEFEYIY
jgi:hypothetical protein